MSAAAMTACNGNRALTRRWQLFLLQAGDQPYMGDHLAAAEFNVMNLYRLLQALLQGWPPAAPVSCLSNCKAALLRPLLDANFMTVWFCSKELPAVLHLKEDHVAPFDDSGRIEKIWPLPEPKNVALDEKLGAWKLRALRRLLQM